MKIELNRKFLITNVLLAVCAGIGTIVLLLLIDNIATRKIEARQTVLEVVKIDDNTVDPKVWGYNFPRQYDSYLLTATTDRSRHGGSESLSKIDGEWSKWRTIFSGYAFGIDYREKRGHAFMLEDQQKTRRVTEFNQPGACLHCHASMVNVYRDAGLKAGASQGKENLEEQIMKGFAEINPMPYKEAVKLAEMPISCIDCHDPDTMQLRITRPAFLDGIRNLALSDYPVPQMPSIERWRKSSKKEIYNPDTMASRQEMRSMVCAQCHVEYYFKGPEKRVVFPWHNGLGMDEAEKYYDDQNFSDWTHKISGAKVIKAQHPEYELWSKGIHSRSGVSCADCHMPYQREGAMKVSDHHVKTPMLDVAASCQTCHSHSEAELIARVDNIQKTTVKLLRQTETAVVDLINAIQSFAALHENDAVMQTRIAEARKYQRQAQWRIDYIAAENSKGFHAPQEAARILGESIDFARKGELALYRP
jgi:nitrite reductase (cytochrome c-552)